MSPPETQEPPGGQPEADPVPAKTPTNARKGNTEDRALRAVLERSRAHGSLGPGPIDTHLAHSRGFVAVAEQALGRVPGRVLDLGSGGGVPGLVLAAAWPEAEVTLIDAAQRRVRDLSAAATELFGSSPRVTVVEARAEVLAHDPPFRERADLVTARSFGPPALTAEIGAGFLAVDGVLVVSEPPGGDPARWPGDLLAELGLGPALVTTGGSATYAVLAKVAPAPPDVPRATRVLVKRPRW